jgi:hypothetical protein
LLKSLRFVATRRLWIVNIFARFVVKILQQLLQAVVVWFEYVRRRAIRGPRFDFVGAEAKFQLIQRKHLATAETLATFCLAF